MPHVRLQRQTTGFVTECDRRNLLITLSVRCGETTGVTELKHQTASAI